MDGAADRHHFSHGFHRRGENRLAVLELLEGEARDLGDDIVDRRLERGGCDAGDVVLDLVQSVPDRELGRDLGDREARGLRRQRRGTRHARIHLDDDEPAILRIDRELDVGAACFDADFTQHRDARVAHDLIFLVGQGQRRRDRDRIPGVDAHRVHILDRADDDGIVRPVADHLHLIFLPAEDGFLDQHLVGRRGLEAAADDVLELLAIIGDAAAGAAQREAGADDGREPDMLQCRHGVIHVMGDAALRTLQPDPVHRLPELQPVLRLFDRLGIGADQLHAIFGERPVLEERERGVEPGLPAHRR